jgi:SAM-dependent methyltransferase
MYRKIKSLALQAYIRITKSIAYRKIRDFNDQQFFRLQLDRYFEHLGLNNSLTHTKYLIPLISNLNGICNQSKILIIGPCNKLELNAFESYGYKNIEAIDLVSFDSRIKVMDMHDLKYENNYFDLVYSTNTIHCTKTPNTVGSEIYRVTKNNGYIVLGVTVNLPLNDAVYATDYKTSEGIKSILPNTVTLLYEKIVPPGYEENPHGTDFIKIIVQK